MRGVELRLQKLENSLNIVFSAVAQLKAQIDSLNSQIAKVGPLSTDVQVEEFKTVPLKEARSMVKEYISKNPSCLTSNIIFDLHLEPDLVLKALGELKKAGKIRSEEVV